MALGVSARSGSNPLPEPMPECERTTIERETKDLSAGSGLDEQAGSAEVEGSLRRAAGRQDEPGEGNRGMGVECRINRVATIVIEPSFGRRRFGLRRGLSRIPRTALARHNRSGETVIGQRNGRRKSYRFGTRRVTTAIRGRLRGAARTGRLDRRLGRASRGFADQRQHPYDRHESDARETEVMTKSKHEVHRTEFTQRTTTSGLYTPGLINQFQNIDRMVVPPQIIVRPSREMVWRFRPYLGQEAANPYFSEKSWRPGQSFEAARG